MVLRQPAAAAAASLGVGTLAPGCLPASCRQCLPPQHTTPDPWTPRPASHTPACRPEHTRSLLTLYPLHTGTRRWCRHFPELPNPFSDDQLQALAMPILLVAAEHDVFGAGRGTIARARELWPEAQCEAVLQEGGKHVGSDARWADASRRVLAFFERVVRQGTAAAVQQAQ